MILLALLLVGSARAGDADWLRGLHGKRATTRAEVLIAAGLLTDDEHWEPDARWAVRSAEAHHLVRGDDTQNLSEVATRGYGCSVFARALKLRGGVFMRLTGQSGRYAHRELVLHRLIPDGPSHLVLTGDELVGLLDGAAKFQENGPSRPPGM